MDGRNTRIAQRWTNADIKRTNALAKELLATSPDVIFASTTPATAALHRETSTILIIFTTVSDPVGAGFVASLPRPGDNITGFTQTDPALGGKWLGLLKDIASGIKRAGIMFNPDTAPGGGNLFLDWFEAAARSLAVEPVPMRVRSDAQIEAAIAALDHHQASLAAMDDSFMVVHSRTSPQTQWLTTTCRRYSWGSHSSEKAASSHMVLFRRAAGHVDRILRGEKPIDLPVQASTKYLIAINLKTAKVLG
jgi:putative tryptophan/tyrosine transport system substrate-binding protein